jgi:hypothetical protein
MSHCNESCRPGVWALCPLQQREGVCIHPADRLGSSGPPRGECHFIYHLGLVCGLASVDGGLCHPQLERLAHGGGVRRERCLLRRHSCAHGPKASPTPQVYRSREFLSRIPGELASCTTSDLKSLSESCPGQALKSPDALERQVRPDDQTEALLAGCAESFPSGSPADRRPATSFARAEGTAELEAEVGRGRPLLRKIIKEPFKSEPSRPAP